MTPFRYERAADAGAALAARRARRARNISAAAPTSST